MGRVSELIDTTEMYLRTIFELEEEDVRPMRARIAERLGQSGPTVSQTVARMQRDGLVELDQEDRHLVLTEEGAQLATRVMRKHRLAECLLVDLIGLPWEEVHTEACRWEHVMSEAVEARLIELLDHPSVSPFGNPIPGLSELPGAGPAGPADPDAGGAAEVTLAVAATEEARSVTVLRIGEALQSDESLLAELRRLGAVPGGQVAVSRVGQRVLLGSEQDGINLGPAQAAQIVVAG